MSDDEIRTMAEQHGFGGESLEMAFRLAREVERETRHEYFRFIQHANNAAQARSFTAREFDLMIWNKEHGVKE